MHMDFLSYTAQKLAVASLGSNSHFTLGKCPAGPKLDQHMDIPAASILTLQSAGYVLIGVCVCVFARACMCV